MSVTRIQVELPTEKVRQLEELMLEAGLTTKKDLISNALSLFVWAVREAKEGRVIASVDEHQGKYREVVLPALENALHNARVAGRAPVGVSAATEMPATIQAVLVTPD